MAKQKTDNLELIVLDDHDEDSFYPDHIENLGKINNADKAQTLARIEGDASTLAAAQASIDAEAEARSVADAAKQNIIKQLHGDTDDLSVLQPGEVWVDLDAPSGTTAVGTVAGTVAAGDDPALVAIRSGKYDYVINVRDPQFGAKGDGVTDDTAAFQSAINYAQNLAVAAVAIPSVVVPSGSYVISSTLYWKTASLIGVGDPNSGIRLIWNGAAGATVLSKFAGVTGGNSFPRLENISFRHGTAVPATWVDLTPETGTVDVAMNWRRVHFGRCSGDAVKVGRWTNLHWEHMRWDATGGFAIRATPVSSQNLASFVIDKFTYDNNGGSGGQGFLCIDNSGGASNLGVVKLSDARIELNIAWTGNKSLVQITESGISRSVQIALDSLELATSGASSSGNAVIYRDSGDSSGHVALTARNLLFTSTAAWTIIGGNTGSFQSVAPVANFDLYEMGQGQSAMADLRLYGAPSGTSYPFQVIKSGEANPRLRISNSGTLELGPGGAVAPDVVLSRSAADVLALADGDSLAFGATTGSKLGTSTSQKMGFWGATPIVKPSVSGSRRANPAVAALLTALSDAGLITDLTTTGVALLDGSPSIVKSGNSYWHGTGTAFTTSQFTEGQIRVSPFYFPSDVTLTAIGLEITTPGSAGSLYRLGIYNDNGGVPGTLLLDAGTIDTTQSAGFYSNVISQAIGSGLYWIGAVPQGSAATIATVRASTASNYALTYGASPQSGSNAVAGGFAYNGQSGTLSNWAGLTLASNIPRVQFKVA